VSALAALTRRPAGRLDTCELERLDREPVDLARALVQHARYREALTELGFAVSELPVLETHPDACFVEDPALVLDEVAVLTCPAPASRRAEVEALVEPLAGLRPLLRLGGAPAPAGGPPTLEGGDVLPIDDVLYTGQSARTNHAGLKALAHLVLPHGYRVKAVGVDGCLHLKTGSSFLGRQTLLVNPAWVQVERFAPGYELIEVDPAEPFAANAIAVAGRVLVPAAFPRTAARIAERGFEVLRVDLSEFQRMEAGPTCLSLRFAGSPVT